MTILEALQWGNNKLKRAEIESPMLDAEMLLAHILQIPKARLFSHFNDPLKAYQQEQFSILIDRRATCEPVAYLIGAKSFFGREFQVNPFVLIPRPATETLVESALTFVEKEDDREHTLFVDVGTGSGIIAITLAMETNTPVIAIDLSPHALSVAKQNAKKHRVDELIEFRHGDLLVPVRELFTTIKKTSTKPVSSIYPYKQVVLCANLPYISTHRMEALQKDVRDFEPKSALEAGPDGLAFYWRLFRQLSKWREQFPRRVVTLIEIDPGQAQSAIKLIKHCFPHAEPEIKKDLQGLDRVIMAESLLRNDAG